ncbi:MAG TPA: hypothetical protein VGX28_16925 [Frankiaceae bacterium]|jgi:uncharacterized cupredoxin-like copper-binding protein|nr:hypothetical protein [Frankiaceae bacterium]
MRRRTTRSAAFAATAVLALAACGGDTKDDNGGSKATGSPSATANANAISIEEKEYAYLVNGELTAGWTTLDVKNTGTEYHMMSVGRLKQGKTLQDVTAGLAALFGGGPPGGSPSTGASASAGAEVTASMSPAAFSAPLQESPSTSPSPSASESASSGEGESDPFSEFFEEEIGAPGNVLAPGQSAKFTVDFLKPGTYAMLCFVPAVGDGTPHVAKGMANQFVVKDGNAGTEPQATQTAEVRKDTPPTLNGVTAGETTFKVTNAGSEKHEFAAVRAKSDATTQTEIDEYFTKLFEGDAPPPKDISDAPGRIDAYSFDFPAGETVYVTLRLEAGTYYIGCGLEPEDGGEGHAEKEYAKVTVT